MIAEHPPESASAARELYRALRRSVRSARNETRAAFARVRERRDERHILQFPRPHIVVLREHRRWDNMAFFEWLKSRHPEMGGRFRHTHVRSSTAHQTEGARLLVNAIADPILERDPKLFRRVEEIEAAFEDAGVPIVNRASSLSNGIKSRALALLRECGLKTARVAVMRPQTTFAEIAATVGLPFILRSDVEHASRAHLIHNVSEFNEIDRSAIRSPIALEFLETRHPDGLYRKYRYVLAGEHGMLRHLIITDRWCAHAEDRLRRADVIDEELNAIAGECPFHEELNRGRKALGLDYVAFDYSVAADGGLVVWEPNPFPCLWADFNVSDRYYAYQLPHQDRVYSMILKYYLEQSGLSRQSGEVEA